MEILIPICTELNNLPSTGASWIWYSVFKIYPYHTILVIFLIAAYVIFEVKTRNGTIHYNSENGFSPTFNRLVGSLTYISFQGLIILFASLVSKLAYCTPWPYFLHIAVWFTTGNFLRWAGFWVYKKEPTRKKYPKYRRYKK